MAGSNWARNTSPHSVLETEPRSVRPLKTNPCLASGSGTALTAVSSIPRAAIAGGSGADAAEEEFRQH